MPIAVSAFEGDKLAQQGTVDVFIRGIGIKGQPTDWLQMSAAVFATNYTDLPYQVSEQRAGPSTGSFFWRQVYRFQVLQ